MGVVEQVILLVQTLTLITAQKYLYLSDQPLQNILYDDTSKRVFVGGTNQITRLSVSISFYSYCYNMHEYILVYVDVVNNSLVCPV